MAQHFLLSKEAKELSVFEVLTMSDDEVRIRFAQLRWGCADLQACPDCGLVDSHKYFPAQRLWRCKSCNWAFSVTTGTVFHRHRLPLRTIFAATLLYANAVKGVSALQMSRELKVEHKTAFVLLHKLRESILKARDTDMFSGEVEIDAAHVHNYVRPKNVGNERVDRREKENRNENECIVLVLRERHAKPPVVVVPPPDESIAAGVPPGETTGVETALSVATPGAQGALPAEAGPAAPAATGTATTPRKEKKKKRRQLGPGAKRTRTFVLRTENKDDVMVIVRANVQAGAKIFSDEAPAYTDLSANWDHHVVNHSKEYSGEKGENENQAESYIVRFRRMLMGQIHHNHRKYLDVYANEAGFREDRRRVSNKAFTYEVLEKCLQSGPSADWTGYWQGNHRQDDPVVSYA